MDWSNISLADLAGFLSEELRKRGIDTVLVGGACVTIYSENRYQSYDLDFVSYETPRKIKLALKELGFKEKNKYFQHDLCQWLVEFVSPPVAIGHESIQKFNFIHTPLGTIKLLRPEDSVKDRLASFYHWNDQESLKQAINICLEQNINFEELEKWSLKEKHENKWQIFKNLLKQKE